MACSPRQIGKTPVEERLAAAGLRLGKIDFVPQPAQQRTAALPASGRSTSPKQVIIKESFMKLPI